MIIEYKISRVQSPILVFQALVVFTLLGLSLGRPGPDSEAAPDLIPLTEELGIRLFPFPHLTRVRARGAGSHTRVSLTQDTAASQTDKRQGLFSDSPLTLTSVKRSFQVSNDQSEMLILMLDMSQKETAARMMCALQINLKL